jgi:predicted Zn-dependent protease
MEMYNSPQNIFGAAFIGATMLVLSAPAEAFGGGSPDPTPAAPVSCSTKTTKNSCQALSHCYWSNSRNACRKKKQSQIDLYEKGRLLAKSGAYEQAIAVLKTADQTDPHVLNYLGYSYRKNGDLKTAIGYYKAALKINPDFVLAREYLGEGYVKAGRLDLAKLELEEIAKRCGKGCQEYVELAAVIDGTDKVTW